MINRIRIKEFKKISDITLDLDRINIFIGANNSGKSSVLQAIQFAIGTAQTGSRVGTRKNSSGDSESFTADASSFLYIPIRDLDALIHDRKLTQSLGTDITFFSESANTTISIKRGKNRNLAVSMTVSELLRTLKDTQAPYCVYTPGLSGISIDEEYKTKAVVLKSATRGDSNLYLRNILLLLKEKTPSWDKFMKSVQRFFPEYSINVEFSADTDETIDAYVEMKDEEDKIIKLPIDTMGTSALQILQILSYVYYFNPPMLILDEPDTHLHPDNQRLLISLLDEISLETGMQILIATHSRHIIDEARDIASFFWMQNGILNKKIISDVDGSQRDLIQILLDLGAMDVCDLTNPNIEWVVCTEDANVNRESYLKNILVSSEFDLGKCKIIPYLGCGKVDSVLFLQEFLKSYMPNLKVIVHRDRDYLNDKEVEDFKNSFERKGIDVWVTPGTDVESLFLSPEHIAAIYDDFSEQEINDLINEVYNDPIVERTSCERLSRHLLELDNKASNNPRHSSNPMEIVEETKKLYSTDPQQYVYGKKALGILKYKLQIAKKKNSLIVSPSTALYQEELHQIMQQ